MDASTHSSNEQGVRRTGIEDSRMVCCTARWIELNQFISTLVAGKRSCLLVAGDVRNSARLLRLSGVISQESSCDAEYLHALRQLEECRRMLR